MIKGGKGCPLVIGVENTRRRRWDNFHPFDFVPRILHIEMKIVTVLGRPLGAHLVHLCCVDLGEL
jgi:hypothetical protein